MRIRHHDDDDDRERQNIIILKVVQLDGSDEFRVQRAAAAAITTHNLRIGHSTNTIDTTSTTAQRLSRNFYSLLSLSSSSLSLLLLYF